MLKNYFTIAVRHLTRHKLFSVINILCLAIGITFSMIIGMYVLQQENVNHTLKNADNQYFIKSKWKEKDLGLDITSISPLAKTLKEEYPALVANYFRYNPVTNIVSAGENHFKEDIAICDTTLVSMFDFPLLYGDKHKVFTNNNSAVITGTMALKLFQKENPLGKTISVQTTVAGIAQDFIVSAVLKDIPLNSVTNLLTGPQYNVFVPLTGNRYFQRGDDVYADWNQTNVLAFVELKQGANAQSLVLPVAKTIRKYTADFVWKNLGAELVPVKDYYLKDNNNAVQKMVTALSLVAGFILLMAIINFVNINIGTSVYRLKEIGLRKVFGSAKKQLIVQFITEAWLLTVIAAVISLALYQLLLPLFSQVLNTTLPSFWQFSLIQIVCLILLVTGIGFISGVYPAFVLSTAAVVNAVKGKTDNLKKGIALRRVLLIVQFSLAITVFICTLNVSRQVNYIFNKDIGYSSEQLLVITALPKQWDSAGVARMENIKNALLQLSAVKSASVVFDLPDGAPAGRIILYPPKGSGTDKQVNLFMAGADEDYAKTFGLQIKAGSFFGNADKSGIVLNETAIKMLGMDVATAPGKQVKTPVGPVTITGVIKDYNFSSMQEAISPLGFAHISSNPTFRYLVLKLNTANIAGAMKEIKASWKSLSPNAPFDYTFMNEKFAALYKAELQLQKAADIATVLNLVIVLMGIIGVVALTLVKRTKEIAVRKVLGADVSNILLLFIKDYALLILVANIIAWPVAYMLTDKWLQNYAYRIEQNGMPYLFVGAFVFIAACTLIALQCLKTASTNPVKNLRTE
jgi:putative ABC transport system permease protein